MRRIARTLRFVGGAFFVVLLLAYYVLEVRHILHHGIKPEAQEVQEGLKEHKIE